MENKDSPIVDIVSEPKIESRFGFGQTNKTLSNKAIKYFSIATVISLSVLFLIKSPDKSLDDSTNGVKTPDSAEITSSQNNYAEFEKYSATDEQTRLKGNTKKNKKVLIVKLPGLEKIDRRNKMKIPPGSLIKAILISGGSNGSVRAEVTESLILQGETLVPTGAILLGVGQSTEDRLTIRFSQMIFKDGSFEAISAEAADAEDKTAGLKGSRLGKYALKYASAVGLNFVGGMTEAMQERDVVGQQVVAKSNAKNALLSGASRATIEMANESMNDLRNKIPEIHINAGTEFYVMFQTSN